jgi:hypothetical protein
MGGLRALAVVLIGLGIAALAYQGFSYTTRDTVLDVGPVEVTREDEEFVPLPPLIGGAAIAGGTLLLLAASRRR